MKSYKYMKKSELLAIAREKNIRVSEKETCKNIIKKLNHAVLYRELDKPAEPAEPAKIHYTREQAAAAEEPTAEEPAKTATAEPAKAETVEPAEYAVTNIPVLYNRPTKSGDYVGDKSITLPSYCYDTSLVSRSRMNGLRSAVAMAVYTILVSYVKDNKKKANDALKSTETALKTADSVTLKNTYQADVYKYRDAVKAYDLQLSALKAYAELNHLHTINLNVLSGLEKACLYWNVTGGKGNEFKGFKFELACNSNLKEVAESVFLIYQNNGLTGKLSESDMKVLSDFRKLVESDITSRWEIPENMKIHISNKTLFHIAIRTYGDIVRDKDNNPIHKSVSLNKFAQGLFREETIEVFEKSKVKPKKDSSFLMKL